ncbi:hypothetical protein QAD02_017257 [Eretmocerus hayati]|uniref:Uncharacterized protein n=1 Tax=Eretmocerus hayati TaxID=131215 RepID=A0ACC2PDG0_9HYME|nr:hypothetical protein QAD02_017257 [Eretmocerus hayati]
MADIRWKLEFFLIIWIPELESTSRRILVSTELARHVHQVSRGVPEEVISAKYRPRCAVFYLLVLHETLVAAGPEPPAVAVDYVGYENVAGDVDAKLDLHVDEDALALPPGSLEHLEHRETRQPHDLVLVAPDLDPVQLEAGADELLLRPLRVVVRVVLEESLLQRRLEPRAFAHACGYCEQTSLVRNTA